MITPEILEQFKDRMHLEGDEDRNLTRILNSSVKELKRICGDYDVTDDVFLELVFERSRYVYNDALEYFNKNFQTEIMNLSMETALSEIDGDDQVIVGGRHATI